MLDLIYIAKFDCLVKRAAREEEARRLPSSARAEDGAAAIALAQRRKRETMAAVRKPRA
jgi:hypothetical protein